MPVREGNLEAPTRHPLDWKNPDFYDQASLTTEMERVFDICHGCRRCFNLCNSFPTLFDAIDESSPKLPIADEDLERADAEKTSAVHLLRFEVPQDQIQLLNGGAELAAGIAHDSYRVDVRSVADNIRQSLLVDLD